MIHRLCLVICFLATSTTGATITDSEDTCIIKKYDEVEDIVVRCTDITIDELSVPGGEQLTLNLQEGTTLTFNGTVIFEFYEWIGPLMLITGNNIRVKGNHGSALHGQGELYWDGLGEWGNVTKPRLFRIEANHSIFDGINLLNCPQGCTTIADSENVTVTNWRIDNLDGDEGVAPDNKFGHNTDGIGISGSNNILIENSIIYNQDDCVGFDSGTNLTARNMFCHGSHGISISATKETLENILVENSIVTMSENGIHIKTHINAGPGLIKNVTYRNITLLDCKYYGINVQQNYVNLPPDEPEDEPPKNNIPIYNLTMEHIYGNTLSGAVPVFILCAEEGCFDWNWNDVTIYGNTKNNCTNYTPEGYNNC